MDSRSTVHSLLEGKLLSSDKRSQVHVKRFAFTGALHVVQRGVKQAPDRFLSWQAHVKETAVGDIPISLVDIIKISLVCRPK